MPMTEVTYDTAMEYIYGNSEGREWILTRKIDDEVWDYKYISGIDNLPEWFPLTGRWHAPLSKLRRFACRRLDESGYIADPLIRKIHQLDRRFQQRKDAHATVR